VRRNVVDDVHTLPAPPRQQGDSGVEQPQALDTFVPARPNRGPKWAILAAVAGLLLGGVAWALLGRGGVEPDKAAVPKAIESAAATAAPAAVTASPPNGKASSPEASAAPTEAAAQTPAEAVSSKVGRAPGAAKRGVKPAPAPPKKVGGSNSKAKAKPGDLLSPY
jgi:hypothetical protein